ncbi:MAG: SpoIIE family protein phosphatase [Candidatus Latescibacteria bacterium]|nr:SpoIIE family protein phosphatase [Candidatus Latescibacterota bacterium]
MQIPRNPYLNRSMIRDPSAFFGRRRQVIRLATRIASDPPQSVALIGDRRSGKSSLLHYIAHPEVTQYLDEPDRTLFLWIDFQQDQQLSIAGFFTMVRDSLQQKLPDGPDFSLDPVGFRQAVAQLDRRGYRLVLLLDEFDRAVRSSQFDAEFFAYLRSLAGSFSLAYLTSSSRDLQQLCYSKEIADSPFFNIFTTLQLGALAKDEALDLIHRPSAATPFALEDHTDDILKLGGRLPFFLQMACSAAFEVLVEEGTYKRDRVEERFLEDAQPNFQFIWDQLDPVGRSLANELGRSRSVDGSDSAYQELVRRGLIMEERQQLFSDAFAAFATNQYRREVGDEPVEVQAQRLRFAEGELQKARELQMGLMPQSNPEVAGLEVAGRCLPCAHVSGDLFAYLELGDERRPRLGVVVADVRGHGMEGAVTALRFSEALRYESKGRTRPAEILSGLNRSLHGTLPPGQFVGCCIGIFDPEAQSLEISCGGFHPPLHYHARQAQVQALDLGDLPLGVKADVNYHSKCFSFGTDDVFLFFSDGIIEAQDDREALYGEERLTDLLNRGGGDQLATVQLIEQLFWDVHRFSVSAGQQDDMTGVAVRIGPPPTTK